MLEYFSKIMWIFKSFAIYLLYNLSLDKQNHFCSFFFNSLIISSPSLSISIFPSPSLSSSICSFPSLNSSNYPPPYSSSSIPPPLPSGLMTCFMKIRLLISYSYYSCISFSSNFGEDLSSKIWVNSILLTLLGVIRTY